MRGKPSLRMKDEEIVKFFAGVLKSDPQTSDAAAAIKTILNFLENDKSETIQELIGQFRRCKEVLCTKTDGSVASIMSGCDIVKQHMTKSSAFDQSDMERCRKVMIRRGSDFLNQMEAGKARMCVEVSSRIVDGMKILTHSRSKNVLRALKTAHERGRRFKLFVTHSLPDESGKKMAEELREHGLSVTVILDASIGYIMEQIDVVMVGAEGVVENGGIINKIGTYSIGLAAKALKKPLYVLCESCKFVRFYPLNQSDLPEKLKHLSSTLKLPGVKLEEEHPLVDYTPPHLINYLFTDLGILVPSAVSDLLGRRARRIRFRIMGDDLPENLRTYKLQLSQVEAALIAEPENRELLKLQNDLKEVIALTTELIKNQVSAAPAETEDEDSFVPEDEGDLKPSVTDWKAGGFCLAPWSKDKSGRLYRAVIEEVNEGGLCTIMFPKWGTPDVTLVSKLRPLPAHMIAKMEGEDDDDEARKASTHATKREDVLKQREYQKKKKQKKQEKMKELEKVRETDKNKWLTFKSKAVTKNKKGVTKESIFRSPENVDGRVGVGTCGVAGRGMTGFKGAKKYQRNV